MILKKRKEKKKGQDKHNNIGRIRGNAYIHIFKVPKYKINIIFISLLLAMIKLKYISSKFKLYVLICHLRYLNLLEAQIVEAVK